MMLRTTIIFCFAVVLSISMPLMAEESSVNSSQNVSLSPEAILQNGIAALAEQFKKGSSQEEMLTFLKQEIAPHFDMDYMARLSSGYYWNMLNGEQRNTFKEYFQRVFFQSLSRQVSNFGNPQIQFYPARPGNKPNEMTLSARVLQPQGVPILMDFRFYRGEQGWKIFDVVADGSSAVLYYRRFYATLVGRYGINALLSAN
jgi:phospholipid transport system substrate-binding protein